MDYSDFLKSKETTAPLTGIKVDTVNPLLFDFQRDIVKWALRRGRAAIFADCGMGKTPMQLSWADAIPGNTLILAPLAVASQTVREGEKFNIKVNHARCQSDVTEGINITNYEMLNNFDVSSFDSVVLDESSILKAYDGKTRTRIIESFRDTKYKLACTATPSPNDYMELGNHSEFLGVMTRSEMLSMFFVHDGGETQKWRLKGHAESDFWKWLCSFCVMIRKPSDLGYCDGDFVLPKLTIKDVVCRSETPNEGFLISLPASTLQERQQARKKTIEDRVNIAADMANADNERWLIWCNLNEESRMLTERIRDAVEVKGSDSDKHKEQSLMDFSRGKIRVLVSKPSIAGFGMNFQCCHNMAFVGLSDSYEQFYQAVRRCWRFGQNRPVNAYIVTADIEGAIVENIKRKERDAERMAINMVDHMHKINEENIKGTTQTKSEYREKVERSDEWTMVLGDCVESIKSVEDNAIGYSVFSPPFSSLYTYSASNRDMGNSKTDDEFENHFAYLINELFRVLQPGRLVSFHCMNLPTSKAHHGYIGIRDFRGDLIRMFESAGFIFHSEVCIWKDPVTAMQRTKALGLLHKQLCKDSTISPQGVPDYLVTMRKPGDNASPVAGELDHFCGDQSTFENTGRLSIDVWQRYASPVWMDINPSNTLQKNSAREHKDERHICPLQLDVIHRAVQLWSNPGDVVLSPFAGIGSEGYESIKLGRKFYGIELKESYYKQAVSNLKHAVSIAHGDLFQSAQ